MAKWHKDGIFIKPLFKMKCLGCRDPLARFTEMGYCLSNFPIDSEKPELYNSYVIDRTYKCNICGFQLVFGIALQEKHFKEIIKNEDEERAKLERRHAENYKMGEDVRQGRFPSKF